MKIAITTFARRSLAGLLVFVCILFGGLRTSQATVVTNFNQASLVTALSSSSPVTFATNGTIILTNSLQITADTTIDGQGQTVTISGSNAVRVFYVTNNVILTLLNLTIANGKSSNGAAIFNAGGTVNLSNCIVSANLAIGNTAKDGKDASAGNNGGAATGGFVGMGGAIYNQGGTVMINRSTLFGNAAAGSNGGIGGDGGAGSQFGGNGGNGAAGASGYGGGIYNLGTVIVTNSTFQFNFASGGDGGAGGNAGSGSFPGIPGDGGKGAGGYGGGIYNLGTATVDNSTFVTNYATGGDTAHAGAGSSDNGANGGAASGGGIYNLNSVSIRNSTFNENVCQGGKGGDVYSGNFLVGGNGGNAYGGAIFNSNFVTIVNCTLATNNATGGTNGLSPFPGNNGSKGQSLGGSIYRSNGEVRLHNTILAKGISGANCAGAMTDDGYNISSDASCNFTSNGSRNNLNPRLGSLANNGGANFTIALLTNSPAIDAGDPAICGGTDQRGVARPQGFSCDIGAYEFAPRYSISGRITEGTNGLSGISISAGTNTTVSQTNGFFSFTGLLTGSYNVAPAAVAGGFSPSNQIVFIGTNAMFPFVGTNATNVNFIANPVSLASSFARVTSNGVFQLQVLGVPGNIYKFQASSNLINWVTIATNTAAVNGIFQLSDTNAAKLPKRFFRAIATSQTSTNGPPPIP